MEPNYFKYKSLLFACILLIHFNVSGQKDTVIHEVNRLPNSVNTVFSEFNPVQTIDGYLYYSSYYPLNIDTIGSIFGNLFITEVFRVKRNADGYGEVEKISSRINDKKNHNANISLSRSKDIMYFTRCIDIENSVGRCEIYVSELKNSGHWSKAKKLPDFINDENSNNTQPFVLKGKDFDVLYFVSDRKGGFGAYDIWFSIIKDGEYSKPTNLGSNINTSGDEMTPFYDEYNELLYFSSNAHNSIGGMDIFRALGGLSSWKNIENMGKGINSVSDDMYFSTNSLGESFFASNRIGALNSEGQEFCCTDLFFVQLLKKEIVAEKEDSIISIDTLKISNIDKINNLLPISLYFHNDIPDPGSNKSSTKSNYYNLLIDYQKLITKYEKEYSKGLSGNDSLQAVNDIQDFFNLNVYAGFKKLDTLSSLLLNELQKGKTLNIKIKGYASPLNNAEYNYRLSKRRIASIKNFLLEYEDGVFDKYINGNAENGAKLNIYEEAFGDTKAAKEVSDNPNDKRNSVYSRSAALERKVEIIQFSTGDEKNLEYAYLQIPDKIDFGKIIRGKSKTLVLELENKGKSELEIQNIKSNCDCLEISNNKLSIKPGEKKYIQITLNADNININEIFIKISSNSLSENNTILIQHSIVDE